MFWRHYAFLWPPFLKTTYAPKNLHKSNPNYLFLFNGTQMRRWQQQVTTSKHTHTTLSLLHTHTQPLSLYLTHTLTHRHRNTQTHIHNSLSLSVSHTHTYKVPPFSKHSFSLILFLKKKRKGKRTSVDACGTVFHIHNKARRFCPCVRRLRAIIPFLALKILPFFKQKARYFKSPNKQQCYAAQMRKMCFDNHSLELFLLCRLFSFETSHLHSV